MGLSQTELAEKKGVSYPRVNELIHGKRGVTPETALRLEQLFGMEAQIWPIFSLPGICTRLVTPLLQRAFARSSA